MSNLDLMTNTIIYFILGSHHNLGLASFQGKVQQRDLSSVSLDSHSSSLPHPVAAIPAEMQHGCS